MKVGLYFGTFNPIHVGHLIIANHFAEHSDLEEIWCVVTPQNPFKTKQSVLDNHQRLEMVYLATKEYPKIKPSDIEFQLPQPNYTVHSLAYLEEKYPKHEFALIMGEDNLASLPKWKNAEVLLDRYPIYVYPRKIEQSYAAVDSKGTIIKVDAPIIEISSSFIRKSIKSAKNIRPLLPESVWVYLDEMNFYK
ncbi:nicotinic acid mononucleotide adenylyltransferase [Formosa sp. Hel3_A1_48]|jgi:nicotinate-nucleotide adenylyltransferase|uniref:nicotinate (nicotinamide) nucleotide adenylyltransferase n=1 Tax=Formosa sp. Hel3_A1_48 TaxID=1336795 RepID=UPI00084E24EB|nr:nicotinate (nicotinamide) nucleotide adenylyltransferase [Formosa sp. Hel3_A1_48]AOR26279.1 nicotinic acid mononucleotide adenylyltransferase [Formosa sp. Hel3_A1_48]MDC0949973.1 nicotinate (nicotinamide) nucleotide adenylyltransferase [Flavobacteriaceae bacterium]